VDDPDLQGVGTEEADNAYNLNMRTGTENLPYGIYFGASQIRRELPGFSVSLLTPTLRAEDVPLHTHENASFVFVLSGAYRSGADGAAPVSFSPTLIFNPAGTVHRDSFVLADGRFLAVSISDHSLRVALDWAVLPTAAAAFTSGTGLSTALQLAQQCGAPGPADTDSMEAMCWELLSTQSGVRLWPGQPGNSLPSWTGRARELLHDRCSDALQITEMAQQLGVHPVYFARAFRQVFRCTPGEYRTRCRLRDALALMQNAGIPLSEIALRAGFFDQSHFSTSFRKHFGMAPRAYRIQRQRHVPSAEVQFIQEET
jgi:AraC family transcriptional regulator